jgi:RNA polymerase sigma-70 factor (ECF subfamily)
MQEYQRGIYLLAYSFLSDEGIAEDITQETFIKCYKNIERFTGAAPVTAENVKAAVNAMAENNLRFIFIMILAPLFF